MIKYCCQYCGHVMQADKFSRIYECEICGDKNLKKYTVEQTNVFGYDEDDTDFWPID